MSFCAAVLTLLLVTKLQFIEPLDLPQQVSRPPKILVQSDEVVYAIPKVPVILRCVAEANPSVQVPNGYIWKKNDQLLNTVTGENAPEGSIVMSTEDGTIQFKGSENLNEEQLKLIEGDYQCFASNEFGTAITDVITVKLAASPYQLPENKDIVVRDGDSLSLPCSYNTSNGREIKWTSTTSDNILSKRIAQRLDGGIVFSNVVADLDDRLEFWCIVKDLVTRKSTDGPHYNLRVRRKNPIEEKDVEIVSPQDGNEDVTVLRGQDLQLTCVAVGKPTPTILWDILSGGWPESRKTVKDFGQTVVITNVSTEDEGSYRCSATNGDSNIAMKVVKVTVHAKPYFSSAYNAPQDVIKVPGGNVSMRCQPEGIPAPRVQWMINGQAIESFLTGDENKEIFSNKIQLTNLQKSDSAVYQCIASNKYGSTMEQGYVNVQTWEPVALEENQLKKYQQVKENNIEMKCQFFGSPPPVITWMRDGRSIPLQDRFSLSKQQYLGIKNLQKSDEGAYTCEADNPFGKATVDVALNVLERTLLYCENNYVVKNGSSVTFTVKVIKDPAMPGVNTVRWTKQSEELGDGNSLTLENVNFDDAGIYKASVDTAMDHANAYIKLVVIDKPLHPVELTFTVNDEDPLKVNFSWVPGFDNFSPITGYRIEFEENVYQPGVWKILEDSINGSATTAVVGLSAGVNYRFRARARNVVGWSRESSKITRRYKTPDGLPLNPTGVKGEGTLPGKIKLSWNSVRGIDQNAPGFGYLVTYCPADGEDSCQLEDVSKEDNTIEITGTAPYKPYHIKMQSNNDVGKAVNETEPITVYTGEDVPITSPTGLVIRTFPNKPTEVAARWNPVEEALVRGRVQGYLITFQEKGGKASSNITVGNVKKGIIRGLHPNTKYIFTVSVFNKVGSGPPSEGESTITPQGAPSPGAINVTADSRQARITWSPGQGLPADNILMQYKKDRVGEPWISLPMYHAEPEPMIRTVYNLDPGTSYSFRVISINVYGNSTSPVYTIQTAGTDLQSGGVTSQVWFIVILCMVGLLFVVVLIIFFIQRSKGKKYSVAGKESHSSELQQMNMEFSDYNDEIDDAKSPLTDSTGANSNESTTRLPNERAPPLRRGASIGGDSIGQYDGTDPREFNEDGSFIGQYGVISGESNPSTAVSSPRHETNTQIAHPNGDTV